jgi:hypothetical protein
MEFESDRAALTSDNEDHERVRSAFANAFMQRQEFNRKYPATMKSAEFVDALISTVSHSSGVDLSAEKDALVALADDPNAGRGAVLTRVAAHPAVADAQYNQALVLLQYFGFYRRDPDETSYASLLNTLKNKPLRDTSAARSMVCSFMNSEEFQLRFGILTPHHTRECN